MIVKIISGKCREVMAITKDKLYTLLDTVQKDFLIVEENGNEITIQFDVSEEE